MTVHTAPSYRPPIEGDPVGILRDDGSAVPWCFKTIDPRGHTLFSSPFPGTHTLFSLPGHPSASYGVLWRFSVDCTFLRTCPTCKGRGTVFSKDPAPAPGGGVYQFDACAVCDGAGAVEWDPFAPDAVPPMPPSLVDENGYIWVRVGDHPTSVPIRVL